MTSRLKFNKLYAYNKHSPPPYYHKQVKFIVCIVPAGGTHNQRTSIVNIGNSQLYVTIYKCLHPSSSFSISDKKEELCLWYNGRNITGMIRFQLIKTKFEVICMNVCQSKLIGPSLFFPHVGKGREDSIGISIWSGVVNVLVFFIFGSYMTSCEPASKAFVEVYMYVT